jgi:glucose-1-phosphate thymidylyltransferase
VSIENDTVIEDSKIENTIIRDHSEINASEISGSTVGAFTTLKNVKGKVDVGDHSNLEID